MPEAGGRTTMALVDVHCPACQSINVVQYGKQANGTQRYRCNNRDCPRTIFLLQYTDKGRLPAVKQVNERLLKCLDPAQLDTIIRQVEDAEIDEMWSFVGSKRQQ